MGDIIRIIIKGGSGYGPVNEAYSDKLTIDRSSIKYEYEPVVESNINVPRKWSYKTTSPIFRKLFNEAAVAVEEILNREEGPFVTDLGVTTFTVAYADKAKITKDFILPGDEFKKCFDIITQMLPGCEDKPAVLLTSEDYTDCDEL